MAEQAQGRLTESDAVVWVERLLEPALPWAVLESAVGQRSGSVPTLHYDVSLVHRPGSLSQDTSMMSLKSGILRTFVGGQCVGVH